MRCNRRRTEGECPCCLRSEQRMGRALNAMFQMFHELARFDQSADREWRNLLGDQKSYRMAAKAIGRENLPPMDDLLPDVFNPEE